MAAVEFSRDGATLATASWDGTSRLWQLHALDAPIESLARDAERAWGLALADAHGR